jgi:FtsZ-binding cell division protein ZapB
MQDQEKEFISPEADDSPQSNTKAEPVEIFPETEGIAETEGLDSTLEDETPSPKEETRARRFFRKVIRWTAGLLVVFGLGFLAAVFTIYTPKVDELGQSQNEINQAGDTITSLEDQISTLQNQIDELNNQIDNLNQEIEDIEAQKQALKADQDSFNLHIALLKARSDVVSSQVEIYAGNLPQARVLLQNTDQTLNTIETLLPDDLKDVVAPLRTRLELAISEIDTDSETAIKDLGILAGDLLEIENALLGD